jgi:hypothetical protein
VCLFFLPYDSVIRHEKLQNSCQPSPTPLLSLDPPFCLALYIYVLYFYHHTDTTSSTTNDPLNPTQLNATPCNAMQLEKEISRLGQQIVEADAALVAQAGEGFSVLAELAAKADSLRARLETSEARWLELAEVAE